MDALESGSYLRVSGFSRKWVQNLMIQTEEAV